VPGDPAGNDGGGQGQRRGQRVLPKSAFEHGMRRARWKLELDC
jgi:hypothetical protein